MEQPNTNTTSTERLSSAESGTRRAPNIFKLKLGDPSWTTDPILQKKIWGAESVIAGINALGITTTQYNGNQEGQSDDPKKQKYDTLSDLALEISELNKHTRPAIDYSRLVPPERNPSFKRLKSVPETRYDREEESGPIMYPPGTQFIDIVIDKPEDLDAFRKRWDILVHELRTPLTASLAFMEHAENHARIKAAERLNLNSKVAEIDQITGVDIDDKDLDQLRIRLQDTIEVIEEDGVEILANINPQEDRTALDFQSQLISKLRPDFPEGVIQNPIFILNTSGRIWLEELGKKVAIPVEGSGIDSNGDKLASEIRSIVSEFDTQQSENHEQLRLRTNISPQLMQQIQFIWGTGKMRRIADNERQNLPKSFGITQTNKDQVDYSQMRVTPTVEIIEGNKVELGIEDNGKGLPEGFPGITEGYTEWKGTAAGTGVGLHAQMINLQTYYNGNLELRPNPKGGAILVTTLPLKLAT